MSYERKTLLPRHTWHTLEGQKGEEEAPLARMGRVHVYAVMFFLEISQGLSPSACALPQTPSLSVKSHEVQHLLLLLWCGRALQFVYEASHKILIIRCSALCRYGGKWKKSRAWSGKGGKLLFVY